jgi:hypothetical protein
MSSVVNSVEYGFGLLTSGMYSQVAAIVVELNSKPIVSGSSIL